MFEGDSIAVWPPTNTNFTALTEGSYGPYSVLSNVAVGGSTIANVTSRATTVDALYNASARVNIEVLFVGTNDVFGGCIGCTGVDAATFVANLKTYCQARRATGFKVVLLTLLSQDSKNTLRNDINTRIRADPSFYDALADTGVSTQPLGADSAYTDASLFIVGNTLHPTNPLGHSYLAQIVIAAMRTVIP